MRRFACFCLCLAAMCVCLEAQATTTDLYVINVDENGNGTYSEYSPPVVSSGNLIGSGSLAYGVYGTGGQGMWYDLPYTINIQGYSQWLGIYDYNSSYQSDLIDFQNVSGVGVLSFYSNDTDGDLADVGPAYWSTIVGNWDGFTTAENASGLAFYSTYGDNNGVPGDPYPHPTIETNYYFNSGVPEPGTFALCGIGLLSLIGFGAWRKR